MFTEFEFVEDREGHVGIPIETVKLRSIKAVKSKGESGYDFVDPLDPSKRYKCHCVICDRAMFTLDTTQIGEDRLILKDWVVVAGGRLAFVCSKSCTDLYILTPLEV